MLKWILFVSLCIPSFALEISVESAKDDFIKYSTIKLDNTEAFSCQEIKDNFNTTIQIVCAFSKKPSRKIKDFQNDFFKVHSFVKKDKYFILIKPVHKIKLFSNIFDLSKDDTVFTTQASNAKHWNIIGYNKKIPLLKENSEYSEMALNLPFYLAKDKLPYVGSLDLRGNPVHIKKVQDVKDYLEVKKQYKLGQYESCLETIDDILNIFPNTLFKQELLYYKIKTYDKLHDWDNVIAESKIFLREYSASDNIAEVLSLIAKGYAKLSLSTDADYFFDRLFSEHPNSLFTQWGYIYKGDMLVDAGGSAEAKKFYKKALQETDNIEVAATAAFRLANLLIDSSKKEAAKYIMKIVHAKPLFFAQHFKASQTIMNHFAESGDYQTAAAIAGALLKGIDATYDEYEELLKNRALWLAKTQNKKEALSAINEYLQKFPDGDFIESVENVKNELFFDVSDLNASAKLNEYNKLIEEYADASIGKRALYEKAKLLLKQKEYAKVLALKENLVALDEDIYKDIQSIIKEAATGMMENSLRKKDCMQVLRISKEYNITLSDKWDDGIYMCAMKGGDFSLSKNIALKNMKAKSISARKKWLYRYIKVAFATGNYTDAIEAAKDLTALIEKDKKSSYADVYRILFDAYQRVENQNAMIKSILTIENIFGLDYKDIDRYVAMINVALAMHDDNMLIKYANKIMQIQKKSHSFAQSPFVEFALYQAYLNKEEYLKAYEVIKSLDNIKLNAAERARQKYLLGNILSKLWRDEEAKRAYKASIKADKNSSWAKLAQSALKM